MPQQNQQFNESGGSIESWMNSMQLLLDKQDKITLKELELMQQKVNGFKASAGGFDHLEAQLDLPAAITSGMSSGPCPSIGEPAEGCRYDGPRIHSIPVPADAALSWKKQLSDYAGTAIDQELAVNLGIMPRIGTAAADRDALRKAWDAQQNARKKVIRKADRKKAQATSNIPPEMIPAMQAWTKQYIVDHPGCTAREATIATGDHFKITIQ